MKFLSYTTILFLAAVLLTACNKDPHTPKGVLDLDHHYYAIFFPNNNTAITATRSQAALVKLPVQFYSTFTRPYDAVCKYAVTTFGVTPPAVRGVDYDVVDKNGTVLTPVSDSSFQLIFPGAVQAMDTIYLKMLNNTMPGARKFEVHILENITPEFTVDKFSTAFRRPITIN
ncbi:MAG: hypothetical protein EOP53_13705 [Sphingobacteriales bacterium]|nr:MAG: hypothetical protein EOP53_13705 [Sphingobacteriales bacterium]